MEMSTYQVSTAYYYFNNWMGNSCIRENQTYHKLLTSTLLLESIHRIAALMHTSEH